ncbi:hypothetical protein WDW37_11505 [Bdellovibrionota bacterium FG-1]
MKSVYRAEYAPAAWKKKFAHYDLETEFSNALASVQSRPNLTLADAREIFKTFVYSMRDYHTSISFISTEAASLPLSIKGAGDKYFIVYIDRNKLSEASFPFHVNDVQIPNNVGIASFRCTESIAERVDGNPIENLGVKPDLEYELNEADLTQGFVPYVKAVQSAIGSLAK